MVICTNLNIYLYIYVCVCMYIVNKTTVNIKYILIDI